MSWFTRELARATLVGGAALVALGADALLGAQAAFAAGSCGPPPPIADPTPEARSVFDTAVQLSRDGKYDEALAAYQRAYDLSPSYIILHNVGKAAQLTGDSARALAAYECYLEHGGSEIDNGQRSKAEADIAALKKLVGLVAIEVDEASARIEIDSVVVGTSPLAAPVAVNPGRRLVRVMGSKTQAQAIDVVQGARLVVKFDLKAKEESPAGTFRFPGGVVGGAWVVTGLLGVSTAVTATLAFVGSKDIEDDVYLGPSRTPQKGSDLDDKIERTNALATAADVLLTAFVITGSAAITMSVVNAVNKSAEPPAAAVSVGLLPGGVTVFGVFP